MVWATQHLRRGLQHALNDLGVYTVSAGATTSFTSVLAVNATSGASTARFNGAWAYHINSGATVVQQRRVRTNGHTPSTGVTLVYPDWTAPVAGSEVEITRLFPCTDAAGYSMGENQDYRSIINAALRWYDIPDQITLTTVAGAYSYSLATYKGWLTTKDRLLRVYDPPIVSGYPPRDASWRVDRLEWDAGIPTLWLRTPYASGTETIRLDVARTAGSLINSAESTAGLVEEGDLVLDHVLMEEFIDIGLWEAYRALANRGHDGRDWASLAETQEPIARATIARAARRARGLPPEDAPTAPRTAAAPAGVAA